MLKFRKPIVVAIVLLLVSGITIGILKNHFLKDSEQSSHQESSAKKILYYRNPMGLSDISEVPRKDAMGMDYIPVYQNDGAHGLTMDSAKMQNSAAKLETVTRRLVTRQIQLQGRVEVDESRQYVVAPKYEGWIEKVFAGASGQYVSRGAPLFSVFSPDLMAAQKEFLVATTYAATKGDDFELGLFSLLPQSDIALQGAIKSFEGGKADFSRVVDAQWQIRKALEEYTKRIRLPKGSQSIADNALEAQANMRRIAEAAKSRLINLGMPEDRINEIIKNKEPLRLMNFISPVSGIVTEKKAVQGMRFDTGQILYQIADISSVWILADVFEKDIGHLQLGQSVNVVINTYPNKFFHGKINYIYPALNPSTRSVQVRIEMKNSDKLLKPGMFAQLSWTVNADAAGAKVLAVPISAVMDSGQRQHVFIQNDAGALVPVNVKLGMRGDNFVQVVEGLQEGDRVLVAGNFLIDSESNLNAALKAYPGVAKKQVSYHAVGTLDSVDPKTGHVIVTHEPVADLNWPQMTMEFVPSHVGMFAQMKPGMPLSFEFLERKPGEWVIIAIDSKDKTHADRTH